MKQMRPHGFMAGASAWVVTQLVGKWHAIRRFLSFVRMKNGVSPWKCRAIEAPQGCVEGWKRGLRFLKTWLRFLKTCLRFLKRGLCFLKKRASLLESVAALLEKEGLLLKKLSALLAKSRLLSF